MAVSEAGRLRRDSDAGTKRQAGRYVLGDLLGRGGMAEVFAGHSLGDHGFQKPVAIKRLLPELANDSVFVERLIQEAKLLVGMTHGNVVSVIDLARDGEDVFLVMDFVDGPSLRQLLKARGTKPLPLGISSYIVQSAAAGLEFAHVRPGGAIIHADISPSNLLLTTSGEVRVADFGIARREGGGFGVVEGKWAYMAPEQARGEPLTPRSDVFALGVVLYELITGAHPFGRQVTAEERELGPVRVIPPRIVKPSVPHGLDAICMRALSHDPRERYASMQKLADAIMDERFTNQWRDGASDLAKLLNEAGPSALQTGGHAAVAGGPRTMVTDRPVTLFTRSLIDMTPARRASSPRVAASRPSRPSQSQLSASRSAASQSHSESLSGYAPSDSSAQTAEQYSSSLSNSESSSIIVEQPPAAPAPAAMAKLLDMPAIFNPNGPAMPTWQFGPHASAQPAAPRELESVHGGTAASSHAGGTGIAAGSDARSNKWAIAVLALAAILGVVAAVVLQMKPAKKADDTTTPTATVAKKDEVKAATPNPPVSDATQPKDLSAPINAAVPAPAPTPAPEPAPAPTVVAPVEPAPAAGSGELPRLTDPSTTAPDAEAVNAATPPPEKAPVVEKIAPVVKAPAVKDTKRPGAARVAPNKPAARPTTTTRPEKRDADEDEKPRKAAVNGEIGYIRVSAYPWGWVQIDGQAKKQSPFRGPLPAGKHTVRIFTDDQSKIRQVEIVEGKLTTINLDWEADQIEER